MTAKTALIEACAEALPTGCHHCGAELPPVPVTGEIKGETLLFCCNGCLSVVRHIYDAGLESYYERRNAAGAPPPVPFETTEEIPGAPRYASVSNGVSSTSLMIEGIHCAACVWLIEKAVKRVPGVVEGSVNFSTHRMLVRWEEGKASLKDIIGKIKSVGYRAVEYDRALEAPLVKKKNDTLLKMSVAGFSAVTTVFLADGLYGGYLWGIDGGFKNFLQWVSLVAAVPAVFYSGSAFILPAWNGLKNKTFTMDLTIALGSLITFFYSVWATLNNRGDVYFDTVAMFIFLILAGRFLEAAYRRKAWSDTERTTRLAVDSVTVVRDGGRATVPVGSITPGDIIEVRPGGVVPLDGVVIEGSSSVDESMLTGESRPVKKSPGSGVYASTVNAHGTFRFKVTKTGEDTVLSKITRLVEEAQANKARVQVLSDRIAGYFVPLILIAAAATYIGWSFYDPARAVVYAVAVLIITCPCALALATPAAIITGCGAAAKDGIIVKSGAALEKLHRATHIVFDKTGTLTEGRMSVVGVVPAAGESEDGVLSTAALSEQFSEHPIGKAVCAEARKRALLSAGPGWEFRAVPGKGVEATVKRGLKEKAPGRVVGLQEVSVRQTVVAGNRAFVAGYGVEIPAEILKAEEKSNGSGETAVYVAATGVDGSMRLTGLIMLSDPPRGNSAGLVERLKGMGLKVTMLSGDNLMTAGAIAQRLGIESVVAGVLPDEKEETIRRFKEGGDVVVMVGDGINDGPALASSDVGVAVGSGTGLAVGSADIVLLNPDPMTVLRAVEISRNTFGAIKGNLVVSLLYNTILTPLAALGYIVPVVAAVAMPVSSILVVGNSVKASRKKMEG